MISTFERLRAILVKDYQLAPEAVTMEAKLESLGIDSLGVAELLFSIEDEYRVTLPPEPVDLETVGEVVHYIDALVAGRRPAGLKPMLVGHPVYATSVSASMSAAHAQANASRGVHPDADAHTPAPHIPAPHSS
jgi:acyl carrier protein